MTASIPPITVSFTTKTVDSMGNESYTITQPWYNLFQNIGEIPLPASSGGTGYTSYTLGDIIYGNGSNALSKLAGNTTTTKKFLSQTGNGTISDAPAWSTIAYNNITATDNGAIAYSNGSNIALLASTATANKILMSGASAAPTWSTATYPSAAGASGNVLTSNGTNWVSSSPSGGLARTILLMGC